MYTLLELIVDFPVYGNLPSKTQLVGWERAVAQHSAVPQTVLVRNRPSFVDDLLAFESNEYKVLF